MSLDRLLREARTPTVYDEIVRLRRLLKAAKDVLVEGRVNLGDDLDGTIYEDLAVAVRECETP